MTNNSTVFLDIIENKKPAHKIFEDDQTIAILDINPVTKGHCLVIPKQPVDHIDDCSPELYAAIFKTVHVVTKKVRKAFKPQRVSIVVHGYEVPHAHVHVVPLYDGKELHFADRQKAARTATQLHEDLSELKAVANE